MVLENLLFHLKIINRTLLFCAGSGTETYGANNIPLSYPGYPGINESWKWAASTAGDWANDLWLPGTGIMPVKIKVYNKPTGP